MTTDALIAKTREIAQRHYSGMQKLDMKAEAPDILRKDLYSELKVTFPNLTEQDMQQLYDALDTKGYIKLLTNDIVTFDSSFV